MNFEIFKVEKVNIDIDFEKLYQIIKEELDITPEKYGDIEDYCFAITSHYEMNDTHYLTEVFDINFEDNSDDKPYYDIEANDEVLHNIYDAFEDYVFDKHKK